MEVIPHPLYSPDLAPSDFRLLRSLSNNLREIPFDDDVALQNDLVKSLPNHSIVCWQAIENNGGKSIN